MSPFVVSLWFRPRTLVPALTTRHALAAITGFAILATGFATPASGQSTPAQPRIYSCEDDQGRVISSDRPIRDCARREMRVLNRDGSLREIVPPPLTREQRKQAERAELERKDAQARTRARQARDRSLLITFEDENSLETMRRRHLAEIDAEIRVATGRILTLDKDLKTAQAEADRQQRERAGRPLPFIFHQRITDAANAILAEDALIRDRQNERERINERFDADATRLRELLGQPAPAMAATRTGAPDERAETPAPASSPTPVNEQDQARAPR